VTMPSHLRADQVKGFALAAGRVALEMGADWLTRPMRHPRVQTSTAPELPAKRAAWNRLRAALDDLDERRAAFASSPDDLTAERVRWAEVELEDAVAVVGEFQVHDLPWSLA
jgi:hypothetical protein